MIRPGIPAAPFLFVDAIGGGGAGVLRMGGSMDLQARQRGVLPDGVLVADPTPAWLRKELGGGDFEPRFRPWALRVPVNVIAIAPIVAQPDPRYGVGAKPFAWARGPIDLAPQIPSGPSF